MGRIGLGLLTLVLVLVMFPLGDAYSAKIHCADDVDLEKYPSCKYVTEWNESEKFNEYVVDELANRADEINENPHLFSQIYQETIDKINRENPGLEEEGQKIKDWIREQIKNQ